MVRTGHTAASGIILSLQDLALLWAQRGLWADWVASIQLRDGTRPLPPI